MITSRADLDHELRNLNRLSEVELELGTREVGRETLYFLQEKGEDRKYSGRLSLYQTSDEMHNSIVFLADYLDLVLIKRGGPS